VARYGRVKVEFINQQAGDQKDEESKDQSDQVSNLITASESF